MKVSVKRKDVIQIHNALRALDGVVGRCVKLSYAIARNLARLKEEADAIQAAQKKSRAYEKYEQERQAIASTFAIKEKGKDSDELEPVIRNGVYVVARQAEMQEALKPLEEEHAETIKDHEKKLDQLEVLLDGDATIDMYHISPALLELEGALSDDAENLGSILGPLIGTVIKMEDDE